MSGAICTHLNKIKKVFTTLNVQMNQLNIISQSYNYKAKILWSQNTFA